MGEPETHVNGLSDLRTCFDGQFSDNGIRCFFQLHADSWNGPMAQDAMPLRHDMRDAHIVKDGRFGADHRQRPSEVFKV
jgi:hypothetical protein